MKNTSWMMLVTFLLAGLLAWVEIPVGHVAAASQGLDTEDISRKGKAEVVIIVCQTVGTGTPIGSAPFNVTVQGVSRSGGGPAVQVGSDCAQALASVMTVGFRLRDVAVHNFAGVLYTLIDR